MIKIQDIVKSIVLSDEEALYALSKGFMNLSAYAKDIQKDVEKKTFKDVKPTGIVVALSRFKKELKNINPLTQDVKINNVTIKSPLTEIVFEKTPFLLSKLSSLYKKIKTGNDDFLTITLSTNEITVICSDRIKVNILNFFKENPRVIQKGLSSIGLSIDPKYYKLPNVTFSLLRRVAQKRIVLAETITTHTEIIFIFHQKDLAAMAELFHAK